MGRDCRSRVDDRPFVAGTPAHQVGVGAGSGHHAAVVGAHPDDPRRQAHRTARHDRIRRVAVALRIELAHLGPREMIGCHRHHALWAVGDPRHRERLLARRAGVRQHVGGGGETGQGLEGDPGGCQQLERLAARDRLGRLEPELLDQFDLVVGRFLGAGRQRKEEPGVPALGPDRRGDPAGEVGEPVGCQGESEMAAELGHGVFAAVQPGSPGRGNRARRRPCPSRGWPPRHRGRRNGGDTRCPAHRARRRERPRRRCCDRRARPGAAAGPRCRRMSRASPPRWQRGAGPAGGRGTGYRSWRSGR